MILSFMAVMQEEKKSAAKVGHPTGWPRRRKPVMSLTGIAKAVMPVEWSVASLEFNSYGQDIVR